jgi:NAD+ diphosphatase
MSMIATSIYKRYTPGLVPDTSEDRQELWFVFSTNKLLIKTAGNTLRIPTNIDFDLQNINYGYKQYLGLFDGYRCYCMDAEEADIPEEWGFKDLRSLLNNMEEDTFLLAGRAFQLVNWYRMNKYCGRCGSITELKNTERAKVCPKCDAVFYPRISPAVIVAVTWGKKILLAHNKNFRKNLYSLVAGFMDPGETFEDCVQREVMEEVGIKIKNINYFGSQPWPFPDSLMIGLTAEYDSGEICVDNVEISDANWYEWNDIPEIPTKDSIAGKLINNFFEGQL